jgi:hypothetical protein
MLGQLPQSLVLTQTTHGIPHLEPSRPKQLQYGAALAFQQLVCNFGLNRKLSSFSRHFVPLPVRGFAGSPTFEIEFPVFS